MSKKPSDQPSLDFERREYSDCSPRPEDNEDSKESTAEVLSFAEKVAQKEEEHKGELYYGILSRIKHLSFE